MNKRAPIVNISGVKVGGREPIVIQSMTNTPTSDVKATVNQIIELADAGSQMVRFTVDTDEAARAVVEIKKQLKKKGYGSVPLIGDFHFNGHKLLTENPDCARALGKLRINPGNVGLGKKHDENFDTFIKIAIKEGKVVRIGANAGSLDPELLKTMMEKNAKLVSPKSDREVVVQTIVKSVLDAAQRAEKLGLRQNKIILSVKMSELRKMVDAYKVLAKKMETKKHVYALHLGLTEAGSAMQGLISSCAALSILLYEGIGDTIRISLTQEPGESRSKEVEACKILLQSTGFKNYMPHITSCPGCGRANTDLFQKIAKETNDFIKKRINAWKKVNPEVVNLKIAVMGCVVNGPGESKNADIAISLPGKSEKPLAQVYIDGKLFKTIKGKNISKQFQKMLDEYALTASNEITVK